MGAYNSGLSSIERVKAQRSGAKQSSGWKSIERVKAERDQKAFEGYAMQAQGLRPAVSAPGFTPPAQPSAPVQPGQETPFSPMGIGVADAASGFASGLTENLNMIRDLATDGPQAEYAERTMKAQADYQAAEEQAKKLQQYQEDLQQMQQRQRALESSARYLQQLYDNYSRNPSDSAYLTYMEAHKAYSAAVEAYNKDAAAAQKQMDSYGREYAKYAGLLRKAQVEETRAQEAYNELASKQYPKTAEEIQAARDERVRIEGLEAAANKGAWAAKNRLPHAGASAGEWAAATPDGDIAAIGAAAEAERRRDDIRAQADAARKVAAYADYSEKLLPYRELLDNEDFEQNSAFSSKKTGSPVYNTAANSYASAPGMPSVSVPGGGGVQYASTGYDSEEDLEYDYINGDPQAVQIVNSRGIGTTHLVGADGTEKAHLTEDEIAIYNYLYNTQGSEAAGKFLEAIQPYLNERDREAETKFWEEMSKKDPAGATVARIFLAPAGAISGILQTADYLDDGSIDQNAGYNRLSYIPSTIQGEVSQIVGEKWGPVGSFAYNVGLSTADFLLANGLSGGSRAFSLGIMGLRSMADTVIAGKDRGYSDGEAILLGLLAGATEAAAENLSIERLFDFKSLRNSTVKYLIKNVASEGAEEGLTSIANTIWDTVIAGDQSVMAEMVQAYMDQGLSKSEAWGKAVGDKLLEAGVDALAGAVSGGLMSGGSAVMNTAQMRQAGSRIQKTDSGVMTLLELAAASDNAEVKQRAADLQAQLDGGKEVMELSALEIGRLYAAYLQSGKSDAKQPAPETTEAAPAAEAAGADIKITAGTDPSGYTTLTAEAPGAAEARPVAVAPAETTAAPAVDTAAPVAEVVGEAEASPKVVNLNSTSGIRWAGSEVDQLEGFGEILTGDAAEASQELRDEVSRIAGVLGREIEIFRQRETENGLIDGMFDPKTGKLYVNAESAQPAARIIGHELTHATEWGESYQLLSAFVRDRVAKTSNNWQQLRKNVEELYRKNGVELTSEQIDQEVVAEYIAQHLLTDEAAIRELVKQKPSLARRILNWLKGLLPGLRKKSKEYRFVYKAMELYRNALAESEAVRGKQAEGLRAAEEILERYRAGELTDEEFDASLEANEQEYEISDNWAARFSFAGENAKTADLDALAKAKEMQAQDVSAETILKETGNENTVFAEGAVDASNLDTDAEVMTKERADQLVSTLPTKAQEVLGKTERHMVNALGVSLNVPKYARREYLMDIAREISGEVLESGTVSNETLDRLFETAWEQGVIVDREFYDQYKEVKDYLRTTAVNASDQIKADIPDFNLWRKSAFGSLRIVNEGGLDADVMYMELQSMAPELFPQSIQNPSDQIQRMLDVSRSIRLVERTLDQAYGKYADEYKEMDKGRFRSEAQKFLSDLRFVKRYAEDRDRAETERNRPPRIQSMDDLKKSYTELKAARRAQQRAQAKHLLTQSDELQVGRLLRGEIGLEHLDPEEDNVEGITAVYEASREYDRIARDIDRWKARRKAQMREAADKLMQNALHWKDKKVGMLYARETMERNIRDIVGDDEQAQQIIDAYFTPVHEGAAKANRLKNEYRDRVKALNLSRKIAKGNLVSESAAVQILGESMDYIRQLESSRLKDPKINGKTLTDWKAVVTNLWAQNPSLSRAKIEGAVESFRTIYDELFEKLNDARLRNGYGPVGYIKGYFPHFQANQSGLASLFAKGLGIEMTVTELPTSISGLTHQFRPGVQWFGNVLERLGFQTVYDAVEGFDRYIEGAANVIHLTDSIQNLRALASQIRYRSTDAGIQKQVDDIRKREDLSDEDKEVLIRDIMEKAPYTLGHFVVELDEYTNKLAGKKSMRDRSFEANWGRKTYNLIKWWESRVAANLVGLNPGSWLTNLAPLAQGWQDLGRYVVSGMWDTMANLVNHDDMNERSVFLTNRSGSDPLVQKFWQRASNVTGKPMEWIDHFVSASLVRGRYQQNLKRGMSEASAMQEADAWVASVMADRSKGALPTIFEAKNPITKLFTQFQTEVNNELSYIFKDMPREMKEQGVARAAMILFRFLLGRWIFNELYEWLIGRRPMLDPLNMLLDFGFDWAGYERQNLLEETWDTIFSGDDFELLEGTESGDVFDALGGLATNTVENLPFIGGVLGGGRLPVGNSLPGLSSLWSAMKGEYAGRKAGDVVWNELSKVFYNVVMPFGGGQLKKIFQGIEAVARGGSYSVDSEGNDILQYPVANDTWQDKTKNLLQSMIFGKSSLDEATEWVDSGFKSLNAKETAVYQGMLDAGLDSEAAFDFIWELKDAEKTETLSKQAVQKQLLLDSDLSGAVKSVIYYGLFTSEGEDGPDAKRALLNELVDTADMGAVTETLLQLDLADATMTKGAAREQRNIIAASNLTEEEKLTTWRYILGSKDKETGVYALSENVETDLAVFQNAGLTVDQYVDAMNAKEDILAEYKNNTDRELQFYTWVSKQGFTKKEADAVRGCFYSGESSKYDEFLAGGLSHDKAYRICKNLAALKPLEGKKQVSDMQRYEAVLSVNMSASQQMDAMAAVMSKDNYAKLEVAYQYDISPAVFVELKKLAAEAEADGSKELKSFLKSVGTSNAGAMQWSGGLTLTKQQKAVMWQILAGKKYDGRDNPFDRTVGKEVYAMLYPEKNDT